MFQGSHPFRNWGLGTRSLATTSSQFLPKEFSRLTKFFLYFFDNRIHIEIFYLFKFRFVFGFGEDAFFFEQVNQRGKSDNRLKCYVNILVHGQTPFKPL